MFLLKLISQKGQYFLPFDEFYSGSKDPLFEKYKDHPEIRNKEHPRYLDYLSLTLKEYSKIREFEEKDSSLFIKFLNIGISLYIREEELAHTEKKKSPKISTQIPIETRIDIDAGSAYRYMLSLENNGYGHNAAFYKTAKDFNLTHSELGLLFAASRKKKKQKAPA